MPQALQRPAAAQRGATAHLHARVQLGFLAPPGGHGAVHHLERWEWEGWWWWEWCFLIAMSRTSARCWVTSSQSSPFKCNASAKCVQMYSLILAAVPPSPTLQQRRPAAPDLSKVGEAKAGGARPRHRLHEPRDLAQRGGAAQRLRVERGWLGQDGGRCTESDELAA